MNLRQTRVLKDKTQYDVANRSGMKQSVISLIERGYRKARNDEKARLAKALNCHPNQIEWNDETVVGQNS